MTDIFLSYASEDRETAKTVAEALTQAGWSVWWDPRIPAGRTYREVITSALAAARCIVVLWSKQSVNSRWVQEEAEEGFRKRALIPILIDDVEVPLGFRSIQAARLLPGTSNSSTLEQLRHDVEEILGPPTPELAIGTVFAPSLKPPAPAGEPLEETTPVPAPAAARSADVALGLTWLGTQDWRAPHMLFLSIIWLLFVESIVIIVLFALRPPFNDPLDALFTGLVFAFAGSQLLVSVAILISHPGSPFDRAVRFLSVIPITVYFTIVIILLVTEVAGPKELFITITFGISPLAALFASWWLKPRIARSLEAHAGTDR